jgi:hypothetical protein
MQLFLFLLIPAGIFYGYWYFIRKAQPIFARAQTTQNFDSVVPIMEEQQIELLYENESSEMEQPVLLENDESVLLMEAERIITEIENIIAAKENVVEKIKMLLSGFNLFYNTDYQEAINRFIAATLKRECMIELPDAEIAALWN